MAELTISSDEIRGALERYVSSYTPEISREESDRVITAGRDQLDAQRATIVRELRAEIGELSVDLASRIVGEALADEARRKGTVERFLNELETAGER